MNIDKKIKYDVQGGVKNYLGKQKQVKAPLKWQSGPDKPSTELAYITEAEKNLILKANIHGGLENGPNTGPSGNMSLDSQGYRGGSEDKGTNEDGSNNPGNDGPVDTGDLGTEEANVAANVSANMDSRDRARANMYTNMPTPTVTVGVDKFGNPINVPTTYTAKRNRQLALDTLNKKGISVFDPRVTRTFNPFDMSLVAQPTQKKFNLVRDLVVPVGLGMINPSLAAKYNKAKTALTVAKNVSKFAETIGLTDKNVVDAFTGNFTDKFSGFGKGKTSTKNTSTKDKDIFTGGGGDGIEGLGNNDALNQEYLLLLNKFNQGVFTDADQVRFTFLQKILGK